MQPMLAGKYVEEKIQGMLPVYAQPKFDGIRMIVQDGVGYTRSMKPVRSQQVQALIAYNKDAFEGKDGELICGDPTAKDCYRRTMQSVMSFDKPDDELKFVVFDQWDLAESFASRWKYLNWCKKSHADCSGLFFGKVWHPRMELCETSLLGSIDEITEFEAKLLAEGHEGVILRNPNGFYKFGRGTPSKGELIKLKQFKDTEGRVIGFHELYHNGNPAMTNELGYTEHSGHKENLVPMDTLGALEVRGFFPDGTEYNVRIGTGFDQQTRDEIWHCRQDYLGKIVKFKYFEGGIKEAPRFPVFLGFRDGDDIGELKGEPQAQGSLF